MSAGNQERRENKVEFRVIKTISLFLNPLNNFEEEKQVIEYRVDPLTGSVSILNPKVLDKARMFFGETDYDLLREIVEETSKNCFLCPQNVRKVTPKYSSTILREGRLTKGEATLFPNLYPLSKYHAVVSVSEAHYLELSEFRAELISDALEVSFDFIKKVYKHDREARYMTLNCNYLFPAGASVVHPHFQVVGGETPYTGLKQVLDRSKDYFKEKKSNYWDDLVETEKELGLRYVGATGEVDWVTPFSPTGSNEVLGVVRGKSNFLDLNQEEIKSLSEGISRILRFYGEMGVSSFNFTIYSGALGKKTDWFSCYLKIISRQNVYRNYRNDDYFMQKLLGTEVIVYSPEKVAEMLKKMF